MTNEAALLSQIKDVNRRVGTIGDEVADIGKKVERILTKLERSEQDSRDQDKRLDGLAAERAACKTEVITRLAVLESKSKKSPSEKPPGAGITLTGKTLGAIASGVFLGAGTVGAIVYRLIASN